MSGANAKTNPHGGLPGAQHRWRFHLSALLLLIPVALGPRFFHNATLFLESAGPGGREIGEKAVGPWHVNGAEYLDEAPVDRGAGHMKTFSIRWNWRDAPRIKASYLKIGKPASLGAAGAIFSGSRYRQMADVLIPERAKPDEDLWLTVEGWDGSVHQISIPLDEASPKASAWPQ